MICPKCKMEIKQKNENTKIYFCHNCQTILNEELQKISLPDSIRPLRMPCSGMAEASVIF